MKRSWRWLGLVALGGLGALSAGRSLAVGIPESEALTYSGRLESADGEPLEGTRLVEVELWDAAEDGERLCTSGEELVELAQGRFSVSLPDECPDAVQAQSETWIEVVVDGESFGRSKTGAVPYAVAAAHAVEADQIGSLTPEDLTYVAGTGISVSGTTISASISCPSGSHRALRAVTPNGPVECISALVGINNGTVSQPSDVTGSVNTSNGQVTLTLAGDAVGRNQLDGTEVVVYHPHADCGGGLTTGPSCPSRACGQGAGSTFLYLNCGGDCSLPAPLPCPTTAAGYLIGTDMAP